MIPASARFPRTQRHTDVNLARWRRAITIRPRLRPRGWHEPCRILSLDWTADGHDHRGLACKNACDPLDRIVHPGQVLDVQGRHDIDAGAEQLIYVLPALSRRLPGTFAVGQLVRQRHGRTTGQERVDVQAPEGGAR